MTLDMEHSSAPLQAPASDGGEGQDEAVQAIGLSPEDGIRQVKLQVFRATRQEEVLKMRDIGREFHLESRYGHLPFSEKKFVQFVSRAISRPDDMLALYVTYRGAIVGVLNAGVGDYYLSEGGRMVTVYVMYVSARVRHSLLGGRVGVRLIRMVSDWGRAQGAEELHIHATSGIGPEATEKLLSRLGFNVYGGNYAARLG